MRIRELILLCIMGLGLTMAWLEAGQPESSIEVGQVESYEKAIIQTSFGVAAKGRWKKTAGNLKVPSRINTTFITCDKRNMTCHEIGAQLVSPQENPIFKKPQLLPYETDYRIVDWSDDVITAKCEGPAVDIELRISLKDNFAEMRSRQTKARGIKDADPSNFGTWVLE